MEIDPHPVSLNDLGRFAVDHTGHLYWDGYEVQTAISLPWWVNIFIILGALAATAAVGWNIYIYLKDRNSKPHWPR